MESNRKSGADGGPEGFLAPSGNQATELRSVSGEKGPAGRISGAKRDITKDCTGLSWAASPVRRGDATGNGDDVATAARVDPCQVSPPRDASVT